MKSVLILAILFGVTVAQRPTYAGSGPKGRPDLANRFKDPNETDSVPLVNRLGEGGTTSKIPVDARGDFDLVDRLNQWPREHRPFWLLNAEHIEASRNKDINNNNNNSNVSNNGMNTGLLEPNQQQAQQAGNFELNSQDANFGMGEQVQNSGRNSVGNQNGFRADSTFQSRSNIDFEPYPIRQDKTIPVRPAEPRSSFLGPLQ